MVKYVGEAEFDYHSLNYGWGDANAVRAEVTVYRPVAIVSAAAIIADVGRISAVIERINAVIAGGRSLIIAIIAIILSPLIDSALFSIPRRDQIKLFQVFHVFCSFAYFHLHHRVFLCKAINLLIHK